MCMAATYKIKDFYFARTLDYEVSYGDKVTIIPRRYKFKFVEKDTLCYDLNVLYNGCIHYTMM